MSFLIPLDVSEIEKPYLVEVSVVATRLTGQQGPRGI